jgi:hypothetical protein
MLRKIIFVFGSLTPLDACGTVRFEELSVLDVAYFMTGIVLHHTVDERVCCIASGRNTVTCSGAASVHPPMATFEQIINSSTLDIVIPNVTVKFPAKDTDHGVWLQKLTSQEAERQRAFFGTFCLVSFVVYLYARRFLVRRVPRLSPRSSLGATR